MSGLHGDEIEGVVLNSMLLDHLSTAEHETLLDRIFFLPIANPDAFGINRRTNANNVDLNRNWPTKDWSPLFSNPRYPPGPQAGSEIETKVIFEFMRSNRFSVVLDLHSYKDSVVLPLLVEENQSSIRSQCEILGSAIKAPVTYEQDDLGYSIAGGFHTWCFENKIHNITLEIEKGLGQFAIRDRYLDPVVSFLSALTQFPD
jgi:protein MpaA